MSYYRFNTIKEDDINDILNAISSSNGVIRQVVDEEGKKIEQNIGKLRNLLYPDSNKILAYPSSDFVLSDCLCITVNGLYKTNTTVRSVKPLSGNNKYVEVHFRKFIFGSVGLSCVEHPYDVLLGSVPNSIGLSSNGNIRKSGVKSKFMEDGYYNSDVIGIGIKEPKEVRKCIPYKGARVYFTKNGEKIGESLPLEFEHPYVFVTLRGDGASAKVNLGSEKFLLRNK
ncbi:hypothetical protein ACQ4LE_006642 [Meloidogyne hapla]|uniref:B30.2/SPRY domain-containing protein n=1 Tax=Meloidogyne hapla TaxID=6305 RepID=A0A1I8B6U3_MELHA